MNQVDMSAASVGLGAVYLDNAATTQVAPEVVERMLPVFGLGFGNPSSAHPAGRAAAHALNWARQTLGGLTHTAPLDWVFTSGGTEANHLAIRGFAEAQPGPRHALFSAIEHPSVAVQANWLAARGWEVEPIPVDRLGLVDLAALGDRLRPETALVAVMWANNEIGTVQPVAEVAQLVEHAAPQALLHLDAVQAFTKVPPRLDGFSRVTVSIGAHKFHGPKGTGALYRSPGVELRPQQEGGGQEGGLRPGTENVPGAVGLAHAAALALVRLEEFTHNMRRLRDRLIEGAMVLGPASLNGCATRRLCNHASLNFPGISGASLVRGLAERGICASAGAACHAGHSSGPSAVLRAIGHRVDEGTVRFSVSRFTTDKDIDTTLEALAVLWTPPGL